MKKRRFLDVVKFLFASAASVRADDHAASVVDSLKNRAAQGYADAQGALGAMYYSGEGVPQDYAEAFTGFRE